MQPVVHNETEQELPVVYTTEQIAHILGCNLRTARTIMSREDFPLLMVGKNYKVYKDAFIQWMSNRHVQ